MHLQASTSLDKAKETGKSFIEVIHKLSTTCEYIRQIWKGTLNMKSPTFSLDGDRRLRELILYIAEKSCSDPAFGATKLNKLLFYSDFLAYLNFGKAVTGQDYFRLENGPAPRRLLPIRQSMIEDGDIIVQKAEFCGFPQDRVVALRPANKDEFAPHELSLIDKVLELHKGKTASEISEESHEFVGWSLAQDKETIPYEVARLSTKQILTDEELEYGKHLENEAVALSSAV